MPDVAAIHESNQQRMMGLAQRGVQVPGDVIKIISFLEYLLGDDLEEAELHFEENVRAHLDRVDEQIHAVEEQMKSQQARNTLLQGIRKP